MPPSGTNNFFGIKVSKAGIPVNQASNKQLVYKDDFSTKTYYDTTQPRMVEGLLPDGSYGMWVSKPGFDVTDPTAPDNNHLVFNSNQDILKIVKSGTTSITVTNLDSYTTKSVTIPHDLGFIPASLAYVDIQGDLGLPPGRVLTPYGRYEATSTGSIPADRYDLIAYFAFSTDSINAYASIILNDTTFYLQLQGTFTFTYYLMRETAS